MQSLYMQYYAENLHASEICFILQYCAGRGWSIHWAGWVKSILAWATSFPAFLKLLWLESLVSSAVTPAPMGYHMTILSALFCWIVIINFNKKYHVCGMRDAIGVIIYSFIGQIQKIVVVVYSLQVHQMIVIVWYELLNI